MRKTLLTRLGAVATGGTLALAMASPALADHDGDTAVTTVPDSEVTVEEDADVDENKGPRDCEDPLLKVKVDSETGTETLGDVTVEVAAAASGAENHYDVTITGEVDGETAVIHAVHLKAATDYRSYYFDPGVSSATDLTALELKQLSHTWFCFGPEEPGPTPTPTTPPTTEPPASEPPASEPPDEDDEEPELPVTGAQVGGLLVLAGGLLAAGVAMLAVRRRRNLSDLLEG